VGRDPVVVVAAVAVVRSVALALVVVKQAVADSESVAPVWHHLIFADQNTSVNVWVTQMAVDCFIADPNGRKAFLNHEFYNHVWLNVVILDFDIWLSDCLLEYLS